MRIITWNVQWGRGADGRIDTARTVAALRAMGPADVICLQEVAQDFPGLKGGETGDQVALFAAAFPGYEPVFGAGLDVPGDAGARARFGNLILSRPAVGQVFRHLLPCPADPGQPAMQRCCVEAVIAAPWGPLRVLTTHLEYFSQLQRAAQVHALRALQQEVAGLAQAGAPKRRGGSTFAARPRPVSAVLCGDFNCEPGSPEYALLGAEIAPAVPAWRDAWQVANPRRPHAPTAGLHGADWPDRPLCCDFVWVSADLAERVAATSVEATTAASDHQPVVLDLRR